ncbi:uncharacterized protein RCC_00284 [Ramularia collo-cygni]|uniref:Uncharacterized protein n=1 Tax=Ramularia collo-cygni TaxID=112498 RepID=A0A2D3URZ0_9PEZI|nr:uncharacterized protein RCC_00284 [Ramularia collo-cygni]CZT14307.1 uncharacterized protein RCC_00284 [Ramularia collo-cygni]
MSIIERTNPLNLQFCVCVVLNCSCPLGITISKTLLKANALVLGVDSRPKDESLNAGLGTHFQYEQNSPGDVSSEQIMKIVEDRYDQQRMDVVINIVEAGQEEGVKDAVELMEGLAKVIADGARGKGALVTVMGDAHDPEAAHVQNVIDFSKDLASKFGKRGVRCNIVLGAVAIGRDKTSYEAAKENMHALMKTERIANDVSSVDQAKQPVAELYDVGNVTLFLAGDMGENISGAIVARDGSYHEI